MKKLLILASIMAVEMNACYQFNSQEEIDTYYANYFEKLLKDVTLGREQLTHTYPTRTYIQQDKYIEDNLTAEEIATIKKAQSLITRWVENSTLVKEAVIFSIKEEKDIITLLSSDAVLFLNKDNTQSSMLNMFQLFLTFLCNIEDKRFAHLLLKEYQTNSNLQELLQFDRMSRCKHLYHIQRCIHIEFLYQILTLRSSLKNPTSHA